MANDGNNSNKKSGIHHANIRDKERLQKRLKASFRKVKLALTVDTEARDTNCLCVVNEIRTGGTYVFTNEKFKKNTSITLHLVNPLEIDVKCRVRYSEAIESAGIKKANLKKQYRTYLEFVLTSDLEKEALEDFYHSIRDESYVATRWHHYISQKAQAEQRIKAQEEKMREAIKEAQDEPELAKEDMIVDDDDNSGSGESAA